MKLYKFIIVIIVLLFLTATSTYIFLTSDFFENDNKDINENTVNEIKKTVMMQ